MRIAAVIIIAAGLAMTACSKERAVAVKEGAEAAAGEIKTAAVTIKNDPDVKEAGTAIKDSVVDGGVAVKQVAVAAGDAAKDAAVKTRDAASEAADRTKAAAADTRADLRTEPADTAVNPRR